MANVIKHKRGSGSDPSASNLVIGELAIRTDVGKLFTKMDSGAIAEIAGGGSDIAINTLSSSSATGGGSATFNGSAYRFTLSAPPSVSAQQLLVSINGVIQKPVAGTGQPSEGFSVDGTDIILGDAPAAGSDFFILTFKSLGVSEPADNSVTSAKIVDGTITGTDLATNVDLVNNQKIRFGANNELQIFRSGTESAIVETQGNNLDLAGNRVNLLNQSRTEVMIMAISNGGVELYHNNVKKIETTSAGATVTGAITTTGNLNAKDIILTDTDPSITFTDSDNNPDYRIFASAGRFKLKDATNNVDRVTLDSSGKVGIGTASPSSELHVSALGASDEPTIRLTSENSSIFLRTAGSSGSFPTGGGGNDGELLYLGGDFRVGVGTASKNLIFFNGSGYTERMRINSSGDVGIGTSSPATRLHIEDTAPDLRIKSTNANLGQSDEVSRISIHTSDPTTPTGVGEVFRIKTISANANGADYSTELVSRAGSGGGESKIVLGQGAVGAISFSTNTSGGATERMRIDSSGRLLIATAAATGASTNADDLKIGNTDSGSQRGLTIGSAIAGNIRFADASDDTAGAIVYNHSNDRLAFYAASGQRASIDSNGLKFGSDTAAANALDDYEEGTWTPIFDTSISSGSITVGGYVTQSGFYRKIGSLVYVEAALKTSSVTKNSNGTYDIGGLPFTAASGGGAGTHGILHAGSQANWNVAPDKFDVIAGNTRARARGGLNDGAGSYTNGNSSGFNAGSGQFNRVYFSGVYIAA